MAEGQAPAPVAEGLGVSERSVWRWLGIWRERGDAGLVMRPRRGRPPKLTDAQAAQVVSWLDRSPCAMGFDTELWTAPRVAELIERRFGVRMNHRYVSDWLARRAITPHQQRLRTFFSASHLPWEGLTVFF